jgi:putative FmdB family regulatory protein
VPLYGYGCTNCTHEFETLQEMQDAVLTVCPTCGESALRRLIGGSPKVAAEIKKKATKDRKARDRICRVKRIYTYFCQTKKCRRGKRPILVEHFGDQNPRVICPTCRKPALRGVGGKGPAVVFGAGWWPDKRRKEVKDRFKRQEKRAKEKGIDIEHLRGWAKKHGRVMSPYLMDPIKDGRSDPKDRDNSAGHFHDELQM